MYTPFYIGFGCGNMEKKFSLRWQNTFKFHKPGSLYITEKQFLEESECLNFAPQVKHKVPLYCDLAACKLGRKLLPYMEIVGSSVGGPLLPNMKKWADQWAAEWAAHGNFAMQIRLPIWRQWAAEWAAHGNFVMQINLPIISIYGYSW